MVFNTFIFSQGVIVWKYKTTCFSYDDNNDERHLTSQEYAMLFEELAK